MNRLTNKVVFVDKSGYESTRFYHPYLLIRISGRHVVYLEAEEFSLIIAFCKYDGCLSVGGTTQMLTTVQI